MEREQHYKLKRTGDQTFSLLDQKDELGKIRFLNRHCSKAEINIGKEVFSLNRDSLWKKDLHLKNSKEELVGLFLSDALSRGALKLHSHMYHWRPKNVSWTEWNWETTQGFPILSLKLMPTPTLRGRVLTNGEVEEKEARLLTLLGWFLIVLNEQGLESHIRHAAEKLLLARSGN